MSSTRRNRQVRFSQNFLHDRRLVERLVGEAGLGPDDIVLEIGPGTGIITDVLARRCGHVLAVEKDQQQVGTLQRRFRHQPRVTVFRADFLEFPLPATQYKVFASIPYNITTAIVAKLTSGVSPPDDAFLIVQREAAARFIGAPANTLFALELAPWFDLSIRRELQRTDFRPVPAVDSVLLRVRRRPEPLVPDERRGAYLDLVTALFTAWKPSVLEALSTIAPGDIVQALHATFGSDLSRTPAQLPFVLWLRLFERIVALEDDRVWSAVAGAGERLKEQQSRLMKRHRTPVHHATRRR
ncbi:MAG: SSU rRNA (adenine(1518)-N(6)/adenine(1519)-N(6))-dimethyltransferase [uncultured Thermomicrobiales bacterium]|uniref:SSU rRNA (Adenine(1518)-N(6)/adenine(1519)-N(6))-dimethyltransferase n=1 Tax=uncultured Thermomicrobiales bacterium TaxID=1645740 RepID=A0A6J4U7S8_9BACT|nr:MAG: SSU rRNA (adenine(1518)-N(6)/adenine(1519)-N(6))-dimethyltransferase [uncultured Thermomicrobiales bacterium]